MAGFPKSVRILRSSDFRKTYDGGTRLPGSTFAAFLVRLPDGGGPRIGITVPRALGNAVVRNRIKRRIREAVRARLFLLSPQCQIVINPRRRALTVGFPDLVSEIERLFLRCNAQP